MSQTQPKMNAFRRGISLVVLLLLVLGVLASPRAGLAAVPNVLPKVGLITDGGPIDDNSFNEMAYAGLTRAVTEGLVDGTVYIPTGSPDPDYTAAINNCVAGGNELCITVGFFIADATMAAAFANPTVNFVIADSSWNDEDYPDNLRGTYFAVDEAAYLAGTMAGLMSSSKIIGVIGGMNIPPVNDFITPYIYGAQWADHSVMAHLSYANDFVDETIGAALAQEQLDMGADVIFGVGGSMGNGAIKKAAEQNAWAVGVDVDCYFTAFEGGTVPGSDKLLTSVLKKVDIAMYNTILDQVNGTFTSGTKVENVANGGVGLADYHGLAGTIPTDVVNRINTVSAGIADGSIDVWEPYWKYFVYLPAIVR